MTMIERAARALHRARMAGQHPNPDNFPWEGLSPRDQALLRRDAWAVINALREPSEGIRKALRDNVPVDGHEWDYMPPETLRDGTVLDAEADCWRAQIDAILNESLDADRAAS